ncbi:c-type cytochrome biogenesis protein [gut metagenome]|uniref:C-type cytochrome biogenesis protein n=1 Tax=gut metagenome TaxID=749906 RepID=J9D8F3_9ZZZZ
MIRTVPAPGPWRSFFTGVLTVIVASPCTAPLMGAALGYAVTQPALIALLIFLSLGIGMALPWLILCLWPAWIKHLPRPGRWMNTFKKVMALPILCTVIWLGWVLSKQVTLNGMLLMGCAIGAMAIFLWLLGREQWGRGKNRSLMGVMLVVITSCVVLIGSGNFDRRGSVAGEGNWKVWSQEAVIQSLSEGRPVFVDLTAAWCMTCQANKLSTLNREEVQTRFKTLNYTLLYGDWTNRDPAITELLADFGRSGVPLYLIYRTDGSVDVLPELLTPGILLEALDPSASEP